MLPIGRVIGPRIQTFSLGKTQDQAVFLGFCVLVFPWRIIIALSASDTAGNPFSAHLAKTSAANFDLDRFSLWARSVSTDSMLLSTTIDTCAFLAATLHMLCL